MFLGDFKNVRVGCYRVLFVDVLLLGCEYIEIIVYGDFFVLSDCVDIKCDNSIEVCWNDVLFVEVFLFSVFDVIV